MRHSAGPFTCYFSRSSARKRRFDTDRPVASSTLATSNDGTVHGSTPEVAHSTGFRGNGKAPVSFGLLRSMKAEKKPRQKGREIPAQTSRNTSCHWPQQVTSRSPLSFRSPYQSRSVAQRTECLSSGKDDSMTATPEELNEGVPVNQVPELSGESY